MRIVYIGSGEFGIASLKALLRSHHRLKCLVTRSAKPAGRGQRARPTPVALWAIEHSIPHVETTDINAPQLVAQIAAYKPELIVVIAFGRMIGREVIELAPHDAINVHASLLPKYRGAAPINWAIVNGERQTGISIITVAEKMDAGDILSQLTTEIEPQETAGRLHDRLAELAAPLLIETIDKIEAGKADYSPQDDSIVTFAPKLKKSDGFVNFSEPADLLRRKILGFWPWPGAAALYVSKKTARTEKVTFASAVLVTTANPRHLKPGTIDENLNVVCGKGRLQIMQIKPQGSRLMSFADFVNGRATSPGDRFESLGD